MCDFSDKSWSQLKKLARQVQPEIDEREKEEPATYKCDICGQFHGKYSDVVDHFNETHASVSPLSLPEEHISPIWR